MLDFLIADFPTAGISTYVFIPPLVAFVISFFTSMAGISGAFLILPFQISVLGFTSPSVSATNFLYNVTGTPGGLYRYARERRLAWPVTLIIIAGLIPGVLLGYYLRVTFLPEPETFKFFVGIVLLYVALRLFWDLRPGTRGKGNNRHKSGGRVEHILIRPFSTRFDFIGVTYSFSTVIMLTLALAVGIIGGVFGIGGGAIIAPLCITFFRLPVHAIAGAVLFGTFAASTAGVTFYSLVPINGSVAPPDWALGVLFGLGGLLGMYTGARAQKYIPEGWIKLMLSIIVAIVALRYVLQYVV